MSPISRFVFTALTCPFLLSHGAWATDGTAVGTDTTASEIRSEHSSDILNSVLIAAIANERGDHEMSWVHYMKAATASQNAQLAEKAIDVAQAMQDPLRTDKAVALLASIDPKNERAILLLAVNDLLDRRYDAAASKVQELLQRSGEPKDVLLKFGELANDTVQTLDAYEFLLGLSKNQLLSAEIQLLLARSASQAGLSRPMIQHVDRAIALDPDNVKLLLECADVEYKHNPTKTKERLESFLQKHPDNAHVRLALARILAYTGSQQAVLEQLKTLNASHSRSTMMQWQLGQIAEKARLFEQAKFHYRKFLVYVTQRQNQQLTANSAYVRLGMVAVQQNKPLEALEWLSKVQEGKNFLAVQFKRAEIYAAMGQPDNACQVLRAIPTDSVKEQLVIFRHCADLYFQAKRPQEGVNVLIEAVELDPENSELIYRTAMLASRTDMIETAIDLFKRFISLNPQDAQGYNSLGYLLLTHNRKIDEAALLIEKALDLSDGVDPYILDSMGWLKYRQGDLAAAEDYLRRAQQIQPDTEVLLHLAQVLFAAGKRDEAEAIVRSVLTESPNNAEAISILKTNGINL